MAIFKKSKELENKIEAIMKRLRKEEKEEEEETMDIDSLL